MTTQVDVIIPTLNAEDYISEALKSVLTQMARGQVLVVDNGSTDRTIEIASGFSGVTVLRENRPGANYARNTGLTHVKTPFVKFLDADDILEQECLQMQLRFAEQVPEYSIVFGNYHLERNGKCWHVNIESLCHQKTGCSQLAEIIWRNIPISSPLYPTKMLKIAGGFDVGIQSRQEWNLNVRLSLIGYRFIHCRGLSFVQRAHSGSQRISNRQLEFEQEMETLTRAIAPLRKIDDDSVRDALAAYVWNTGIRFIWDGTPKLSRPFFDLAQSIEACNMHQRQNFFRRYLYRLLGHEKGEISLRKVATTKRALFRLKRKVVSGGLIGKIR